MTFSGISNATLYVPSGSKSAYEAADVWKDFGTIEEMPGGKCGTNLSWALNTSTGQLSITGTGDMYDFNSQPWTDFGSTITTVNISSGVTSIGNNAFSSCTGLTSISIP